MVEIPRKIQEWQHFANTIGFNGERMRGDSTESPFRADPHYLLNEINKFIQSEKPVPQYLRSYFQNAIQHTNLKIGFETAHGTAANERGKRMRDFGIYLDVQYSGFGIHGAMNKKGEELNAFAVVGKRWKMPAATVKDAYYDSVHYMDEIGFQCLFG